MEFLELIDMLLNFLLSTSSNSCKPLFNSSYKNSPQPLTRLLSKLSISSATCSLHKSLREAFVAKLISSAVNHVSVIDRVLPNFSQNCFRPRYPIFLFL